jgi:long-chain acyl-CoA synthetase
VPETANLADAVRRAASGRPDDRALVVVRPAGDEVITWGQVDRRVDAVAAGLRRLNPPARRGFSARVAIVLSNVPEFVDALFGVLRAGLIAVPLNPALTARELKHTLSDSGAAVAIAGAGAGATIEAIRGDLPGLEHLFRTDADAPAGSRWADLVTESPTTGGAAAAVSADDLAVLLYTSGSTGVPKAAMLTHRALIANHRQLDGIDPRIVGPGDVVLLALPLSHAFGLNSSLGAVAWHGACGVLLDRFDPVESLAAVARTEVTVVAGVPQMFAAWARLPDIGEQMASVRVAVSGAAALDSRTARQFLNATRHPVFQGYGLTETAPVVCTALASPTPKVGSIGRPIPEVEIKLVATDGTEIARVGADGLIDADVFDDDFDDDAGGVPGTDPGEIVVRGPNLFSGYWPDAAGGPDAEGWWHTGDVAYADADGDLFLVDRLGELIIVSGFNVYPHEVELVLASHPGVVEAAAVGVDDDRTGQAVKAFVVRAEDSAVTEADLSVHCERNLARFKCPTQFEFVPSLPHSATGKVRKSDLRTQSGQVSGPA